MSKIDFDKKETSFNKQITSIITKYLEVQRKLNSVTTKDYNFFLVEFILYVMTDLKHICLSRKRYRLCS